MPERIVCYGYGWSYEEDAGAIYNDIDDMLEVIEDIAIEGGEPELEFISQEELLRRWDSAVEDIRETYKAKGKPIFGINVKDRHGGWGALFVCFKKR